MTESWRGLSRHMDTASARPLAAGSNMFYQQVNSYLMATPKPHLSRTILVVEDHASLREFVANMLQAEGYRVLTAENGRRAVNVAASYDGPVDLLLCDFELPLMNGAAAAREILATRPDMRVIIMSAWSPQWDQLDPAWEFLGKPFSAALLMARLAAAMGRARGIGAS